MNLWICPYCGFEYEDTLGLDPKDGDAVWHQCPKRKWNTRHLKKQLA